MTRLRTIAAVFLALVGAVPAALAQDATPAAAIEPGSRVSIEYTLRDDGGTVLDTNRGRAPLTYVQGQRQIVPGLERALTGMQAGEEKQVTVAPADGYGDVDPGALAVVPKDLIPADARIAGTDLVARGPEGATRLVRVKEVHAETVVLDLNHPLAGKTLHFTIRVVGVEPPGKE